MKKITLVALLILVMASTITAFAEPVKMPDGYVLTEGGINRIDGRPTAESRDALVKLEQEIRDKGYICISGKDKDISDEEYELFTNSEYLRAPYPEYTSKENIFRWEYMKVYVPKELFDKSLEMIKKKENVSWTNIEGYLRFTVVVINYGEWYQKERIGKVVNEYDDNLPKWCVDVGYLQLKSPINTIVRLRDVYEHTINEFYVKKDVPLTVKVSQSGYEVEVINNLNIADAEIALPYKNNIQITKENTESSPYILDFENIVKKYNIESVNFDEKDKEGDKEEEKKKEKEEEKKKDEEGDIGSEQTQVTQKESRTMLSLLLVFFSIVLILVLAYVLKKKERKNGK